MAVFKNTLVTRKGRELLTNAISRNKRIFFTKIETSSRIYGDEEDLENLLTIQNIKQTSPISNTKRENEDTVIVNAIFTNRDLVQGYEIQTIACYAKLENETEILYSITRANTADTMPANNGVNLSTIDIELITNISNNINVVIQYNPNGMVTKSTLATNTDYGLVTLNQIRGMIPDVPNASTTTTGKVQLSSSTNSNSETVAATSKAVKSVYDLANSKQSPATTLAGYGITNFKVENARGNLNDFRTDGHYYFSSGTNLPGSGAWHIEVISGGNTNNVRQIARKVNNEEVQERYYNGSWSQWKKVGSDGIQVGSIVSFPKEITNPLGFLRCDGSTFSSSTYPDLYQVMGRKNKLPDLRRSDVGMLAYFPQDTIPDGWLPCNHSSGSAHGIERDKYPELYDYLVPKYGTFNSGGKTYAYLPHPEDRFIRSAHGGLAVGQKQTGSLIASDSTDGGTPFSPYVKTIGASYAETANKVGLDIINANEMSSYDAGLGWVQGDYGNKNRNETLSPAAQNPSSTGHLVGVARPKSIVFKLCIKARNTFDDVVFWIKAFGEVVNSGSLDAGRLAQDIQTIRSDVSNINNRIRTATATQEGLVTLNKIREMLPNISLQWRQIYNGTFTGTSSSSGISLPSSWNECLVYYSGYGDRRKVSTILIPSTSLDLDYSTDQWEVVEGKVRVSSNKLYITDRGSGNDGHILRVCIR